MEISRYISPSKSIYRIGPDLTSTPPTSPLSSAYPSSSAALVPSRLMNSCSHHRRYSVRDISSLPCLIMHYILPYSNQAFQYKKKCVIMSSRLLLTMATAISSSRWILSISARIWTISSLQTSLGIWPCSAHTSGRILLRRGGGWKLNQDQCGKLTWMGKCSD